MEFMLPSVHNQPNQAVHHHIHQALAAIEEKHEVTILYACESGSRAWGIDSPDSDFDVRFVYIHSQAHYLSLPTPNQKSRGDVIEVPVYAQDISTQEQPVDLDISGWDIKKALMLFSKPNAVLYEWLNSPIIYTQAPKFMNQLKKLIPIYYQPKPFFYHYLNTAVNQYKNYLEPNKKGLVKLKKYFYALRPLLSAVWIKTNGSLPPMAFLTLVDELKDSTIKVLVMDLIGAKKENPELTHIRPIDQLDQFICDHLMRLSCSEFTATPPPSMKPLNDLFLTTLKAIEDD